MKFLKYFAMFSLLLTGCTSKEDKTSQEEQGTTESGGNEQSSGGSTEGQTEGQTGQETGGNEEGGTTQTVYYTVNFYNGTSLYTSSQVEENTTVTKPTDPAKDDYTFEGWYDANDVQFVFTTPITADLNLYAKFSTDEHEVTFHLNYDNLVEVRSTKDGLVTYIPERTGYVFNGWWYCYGFLDDEPILNKEFLMSTKVNDDGLELYAEWVTEKEFTNQLDSPVVVVEGYDFSWGEVSHASSYNVLVTKGGVEISNDIINSTSFRFVHSLEAGTYSVQIRAIGDGITYRNSAYVTKKFAHLVLTTPQNVSFNEQKCLLQWDEVPVATSYEVRIDSTLVLYTEETFLDLSDLDAGSHSITIGGCADGYLTTTTHYTVKKWTLKTPINIIATYVKSEEKYLVTWDNSLHATSYKVYINGSEVEEIMLCSYTIPRSSPLFINQQLEFSVAAYDRYADYLISDVSEPITLQKVYTITYVNENGSITGDYPEYYTTQDSNITLPSSTKYGSAFIGWELDGEIVTTLDTSLARDITLIARYAGLNVSSNKNDINVSVSTYNPVIGNQVTVNAPESYKYVFIGWFSGNTKVSSDYSYTFEMPSTDYSLEARYCSVSFTTIDSNGGYITSSSMAGNTHQAGDSVVVEVYVYSGYEFEGWFIGDQQVTDSLTIEVELPSEDTTYVAKWHVKDDIPYTVRHLRQSLTSTAYDIIEEEVLQGVANGITEAEPRNYEGFTCQGVTQEEINLDGSTVVEIRYNRNSYNVSFVANNSSAGDIGYHITFVYNDEAGNVVTRLCPPNGPFYAVNPTKSGYMFKGWFKDSGCTQIHDFSEPFTEDTTLYAKYEAFPTKTDAYSQQYIDAFNYYENTTSHSFRIDTDGTSLNGTRKYVYFTAIKDCRFRVSAALTGGNSDLYSTLVVKAATSNYTYGSKTVNNDNFTLVNSSYITAHAGDSYSLEVYRNNTKTTSGGIRVFFENFGNPFSSQAQTSFKYGSTHYAQANTNPGYTFVGWFDGETCVSTNLNETFVTPSSAMTYTAKWSKLSLAKNIDDAGVVTSLTDTYKVGDVVQVEATTFMGYNFDGWYEGENLVSINPSINVTMSAEDRTLEARWHANVLTVTSEDTTKGTVKIGNSYTVTYDLNNGTDTTSTTTVDSVTKLSSYTPTFANHIFRGWYYDKEGTKRLDPNANISDDLTLYAAWQELTTFNDSSEVTGKYIVTNAYQKNSSSNPISFQSKNFNKQYRYFTCTSTGSIYIYVRNYTSGSNTNNTLYIDNLTSGASYTRSGIAYSTNYVGAMYNVKAGDVIRLCFTSQGYSGNENEGISLYITDMSAETLNTTVQSPANVAVGKSVTLVATAKSGYEFDGWYDGDTLVSIESTYEFVMPDSNINYVAKWKPAS